MDSTITGLRFTNFEILFGLQLFSLSIISKNFAKLRLNKNVWTKPDLHFIERQDLKLNLENAEIEIKRLKNVIAQHEESYNTVFNEKEAAALKLGAKNEMYEHFEKKSVEYIKRIREENKKLKRLMKLEADRTQMVYEDLYTRCANACAKYQELLLERLKAQQGESHLNNKIYSLEWDVEVLRIKVRDMKKELEQAKKHTQTLEK